MKIKLQIIAIALVLSALWGEKKIVNIKFSGNTAFPEWELLSAMDMPKPKWYNGIFGNYPPVDRFKIRASLKTIESMYKDKGFLDVRTDFRLEPAGKDTTRVVLVVLIQPGKKYLVDSVQVVVPPPFDAGKLRRQIELAHNDPFSPYKAEKSRQKLVRYFADRGYPYAQVELQWKKDTAAGTVDLKFSAEPGKKVYFGRVSFKGLRKTKRKLVEREVTIVPGKPYSYSEIERTRENLYSTGLFRIVSVEPQNMDEKPDTIDILISFAESRWGWYGFSVNLGANKQYDFTTELSGEWGHKNVFGGGESVALQGAVQAEMIRRWQIVSHRYQVKLTQLWAFGEKIPTSATIYFEPGVKTEQHPYRVQKLGANLGFFKRMGSITHSGGLTYERADIYGVPEDEAEQIKQEQGIVISRKINYTYQRDVRDNPLVPSSGSLFRFGVDFVGGILGGDEHYLKVDTRWSNYLPISSARRAIFANRLQITVMGNTKRGTDVSIHNRLATGGAYSVRGFDELSIGPRTDDSLHTLLGGKVLFLFSAETRYQLLGKLWGHIFVDLGQVWTDWKDVNPNDIRASAGSGLAYITPIGPLRLDYAVVLSKHPYDPKQFSGRWHLAFLYAY